MEEKRQIGVSETVVPVEAELVRLARQGDKAAFGRLVSLHQRRLLRLILGMTKDTDTAMDIVQESFIRAYQAMNRFEEGQPFYPWLSRIAVNLTINLKRRSRRETPFVEESHDAPAGIADPLNQLVTKESDRRFLEAVRELPEPYRDVFVLRTFEELDYEEIAVRLKISVGTVDSRLYRARRQLMETLKEFLT